MKSFKFFSVGFLALTVGALGAGCTAETGSGEEEGEETSASEAISTRVEPGKWKLYSQPRHQPGGSCDVFTSLEISNSNGATAKLMELLDNSGPGPHCRLAVFPNDRSFKLKLTGVSCGSPMYEGKRKVGGKTSTITILDNRHRTCRDLQKAKIILTETVPGFPGAITTTKYSYDGAPPVVDVTVQGNLLRTFGIGGENTGSSIATSSGMFELVLGEWSSAFVAGKTARVTGHKTTLSGVETPDRPAIVVHDMLVCPNAGTLNCMPGPTVRLSSLCSGENRSWVSANCAGVHYVD